MDIKCKFYKNNKIGRYIYCRWIKMKVWKYGKVGTVKLLRET